MLALLLALACTHPADTADTGAADDLWTATLTRSEAVPTVARVRVESEAVLEDVAVVFGDGVRASAEPVDGGWEALLLGSKPSSEVPWRVVASLDGQVLDGVKRRFETGGVPSDLPVISVEDVDPQRSWSGFLVTSLMSEADHPVILDADGDVVWWLDAEPEERVISRLHIAHDGSHLLYMKEQPEERELVRVSWEGEVLESTPMPLAHHDFVELADGSLGLLVMDIRHPEGEPVIGDKLVERAPDGTEVELWSAWDHFEYDPDFKTPAGSGWTHANALDYDKRTDTYTLSVRNFSTLVRVDRGTGEELWRFGGASSSFQIVPPSSAPVLQHQFQVLQREILVFDNGRMDALESRASGFTLDGTEAERTFAYETDPPLYSVALGDVHRFEDESVLVVFSTAGQADQVSPEGELLWRANLSLGAAMGYIDWRSSLYE